MILETEKISTDAGVYTVDLILDEHPSEPDYDGPVLFLDGDSHYFAVEHGNVDDEAKAVIQTLNSRREDSWDHELRSGAAIVRWMKLRGFKGVTLIDRDFRAIEPSTNRRERIQGIAWEDSELTGQHDEDAARSNVKVDMDAWRAWAEGDVFGYVVKDPQGNEVEDGSCWGYYGLDRERDYVLSEARSAAEYDAKDRIEQANRVGAGIVGLI